MVERQTDNLEVEGPIPSTRTKLRCNEIMREDFNIRDWVLNVETKKPEMNILVSLLKNYDATVEFKDSMDVAALHYNLSFRFEDGAIVTIGIILMDHQTDSDIVIETMTTLPKSQKGKGFGSKAIGKVLQWAKDNGLKSVRATQVSNLDSENFWKKNGFIKDEGPNPCNDFIYIIPKQQG